MVKAWRQIFAMVAAVGCLCLPAVVVAASQNFYALNSKPSPGMLVSLTVHPGVVEPASGLNNKNLVGVVAGRSDSNIEQQPGQVSVQTDGIATTLVSTLGGDIRVGDKIGASSVVGIGSKVGNGWIVGTAQASFDRATKGALKTTVATGQSNKHDIYVGSIPVLVKVTYLGSANGSTVPSNGFPSTVQATANTIAGKHASVAGVLMSGAVVFIGVVLAALIITTAIRSGITGIARQPLTKVLIMRSVIRALMLAVIILAVVIAAAYFLLRAL